MERLESYVAGAWHRPDTVRSELVNPSTEEVLAGASTEGVDFEAVLQHARKVGGPALRALTLAQRGEILKAMAAHLREHRDELLALSSLNTGTTRRDGAFDVDGASGTLAYYAALGRKLGDRHSLVDGDGVQLARSEGFWGQHLQVPRRGAAILINAYNFPAWGFAEKAACALLAGMPVITKPATATAMVAERAVRLVLEAGLLPEGALQLLCGSTGDLLERLGPQDVVAFTGSAETAAVLARKPALQRDNARFNVEADSLNAAVLGPGVEAGSPTWELFLRDVVREITQKSGQKCTAVRRILVPAERADEVQEALGERLEAVVTGNPAEASVTMGPLATEGQLQDTLEGIAELRAAAELVVGGGERIDGAGSPSGRGYFVAPTLLRAAPGGPEAVLHEREVFAPVSTLTPYSGDAGEAAEIVARANGTLVTSVYGDDPAWLREAVARTASHTGRIYIGSESSSGEAFGSGSALPQLVHGGPGRAGGGEELGGLRGLSLYLQRVALQGSRETVEAVAGISGSGN